MTVNASTDIVTLSYGGRDFRCDADGKRDRRDQRHGDILARPLADRLQRSVERRDARNRSVRDKRHRIERQLYRERSRPDQQSVQRHAQCRDLGLWIDRNRLAGHRYELHVHGCRSAEHRDVHDHDQRWSRSDEDRYRHLHDERVRRQLMRARLAGLAVAMLLAAGCGGGGSSTAPAVGSAAGTGTASTTASAANGILAFSIAVPGRGATSSTRRTPKYVSTATTQAVIVVTPQGGSPATTTVMCNSVCSGSLTVPPGVANVQLTLEDAAGHALSQGTTAVLIVAGQTNTVRFTLDGIVHAVSLQFAPSALASAAPTTVFLLVNGLDVDGNVITYNGAFVDASDNQVVIKLASSDPSVNAALASYAVSAPGAVLPIPYSGQLALDVTPSVTAGNVPGPILGATLRLRVPNLFVAYSDGTMAVFPPPYTSQSATLYPGDVPQAIALDGAANLFVAGGSTSTIKEYAPPYSGSPATTISTGVALPDAIDIDGAGNLFVANVASNTVTVYAPPVQRRPDATISSGIADRPRSHSIQAGICTLPIPPTVR